MDVFNSSGPGEIFHAGGLSSLGWQDLSKLQKSKIMTPLLCRSVPQKSKLLPLLLCRSVPTNEKTWSRANLYSLMVGNTIFFLPGVYLAEVSIE